MTTTNAICCWDFTLGEDEATQEEIKEWCNGECKKWCFQLEQGVTTGYRHWQGRVSLKTKTRNMIGKLNNRARWSPTQKENFDNFDYVSKEHTRIDGPWKHDDVYIPRQYRDIELRDWQKVVLNSREDWDTRSIHFVYDPIGNTGKSTLVGYGACRKLLRAVPIMDSYRDMMRFVYSVPASKLYIIDMPRALSRKDCNGFWSAVESLKNGYCYDDRYEFREKWFDSPTIWIFANWQPDTSMLSRDRWKFYEMTDVGLKGTACNTLLRPPSTAGTIEIENEDIIPEWDGNMESLE